MRWRPSSGIVVGPGAPFIDRMDAIDDTTQGAPRCGLSRSNILPLRVGDGAEVGVTLPSYSPTISPAPRETSSNACDSSSKAHAMERAQALRPSGRGRVDALAARRIIAQVATAHG